MAQHQFSFFATQDDLLALLKALEASRPLGCVLAGLFEEQPDATERTLPSELLSQQGSRASEYTYLLFAGDYPLQIRRVEQRSGGIRFAVDQLANPGTVVLRPGGLIGERSLLAGQCGTASGDMPSRELFAEIQRQVKRSFIKVKSFYLGGGADALLDAGWRLMAARNAPQEYDLHRD